MIGSCVIVVPHSVSFLKHLCVSICVSNMDLEGVVKGDEKNGIGEVIVDWYSDLM